MKLAGVFAAIVLLSSASTFAASFKGFKSPKDARTLKVEETIVRIKEVDEVFLVVFDNHAAMYRFPKEKDLAPQIRQFLNDRVKSGAKVRAVINPLKVEITEISDLK